MADARHAPAGRSLSGGGLRIPRWLAGAFSQRGLSGIALAGFCALSIAATALGFADLRAASTETEQLPPVEIALIVATTLFIVCAMVVALYNAFSHRNWAVRPLALACYLFFAFWSIGFGYGFFWKELAGREFTERRFQVMATGVSDALARASNALDAAQAAANDAAALSRQRAEIEAATGGACANRPRSTPGDGPLVRGRIAVADRAAAIASDMGGVWVTPLGAQADKLQARVAAAVRREAPAAASPEETELLQRLAGAANLTREERRRLFTSVHEDARAFVEEANGLRAIHAAAFAARLRQLADEVGADPSLPGQPDAARAADPGYCWDVVLEDRLRAAADAIAAVAPLDLPAFEFIEGPKATRAAFFSLANWLGGLFGASTPGQETEFGEKEFLALFASIAVDLGIFFLTIVRDHEAGSGGGVQTVRGRAGYAPAPFGLSGLLGGKGGTRRRNRSRS